MKTTKAQRHGLPVIHDRAAGIDIGSRFHVVAVPADITEEAVQTFNAFTADLERMAAWLVDLGITTVAMESTGVYWIPVYEILESHGLQVVLANARDARAVPGRKTDVNDAQWIQRLHACGLLRASFHPDREIAALRSYLRLRERHLDYAAAHIQHMQKALTHMNLQLHHVVTDITGATGMRIIRAIVAGERDALILARMRDTRCKSSLEIIRSALVGNYQPEHVFALAQALAMYDAYQMQLELCDQQIARSLHQLAQQKPLPGEPLPKARHPTRQPNALNFDVRTLLYQLVGVDLTQIHGIGPYLALRLVAECGTDLSRWRTAQHFTSWLTLAPGCRISGGKVLSAHTRKTKNRVTAHLRLAAVTIGKTNTALGAFYRRLSARIGKAKAVTATARKIAILFYNAMRFGMAYEDPGADHYEQKYRERVVKGLHRRAAEFGFTLQAVEGVS
ncbi:MULTISPECIES: IS110 family transposase [Pseudomonas]|jgi:transposase|uniref:Transposase n=1 Tax=Pseudomonas citronellolis TaxID=53408 RepID=A0A1A9K5R7_9PSED|nr:MULTISPECIES: IS110 family transposase [Pseudomonas]ANI13007.1 transposase [Pseudomonas citronellolis]KWR74358.1 transposase [Pseudomonas sp. PI1]OKS39961.1 IS110 family transposase [Pseudomonas aeruginosa]GLU42371.1 IS110 family transposase [Pseudomonas sp. NBRC 100443]